MPPTMPTREAPRARTMSSAPLTEVSQEPHDGLVAHELAPREQVLDGRDEPPLGIHGEGDLQPRPPVAWGVRWIQIAESGRGFVQGHHDLGVSGRPADLVEVPGGVPYEPAIQAVPARDLTDEELEGRLLQAERAGGHELPLPEPCGSGESRPPWDDNGVLGRTRGHIVRHEGVVMDDEVAGGHAVGGEGGRAVRHRLERLPGAEPAPLEALLEQGIHTGHECGPSDEEDVVDRARADARLFEDFVQRDGQAAKEAVLLEHSREPRACEGEEAASGPAARLARRTRWGEEKLRAFVEEDRFLDPAGLRQHQAAPQPSGLVVGRILQGPSDLPAEVRQPPSVHRIAAPLTAALGQDRRLAAERSLWRGA